MILGQTPQLTNEQYTPGIAGLSSGGIVTAWISQGEVVAQRYSAGGALLGRDTIATTGTQVSVSGLASGGYVTSWTAADADGSGIKVRAYDAAGAPVGAAINVNTVTAGTQAQSEVVGLADGRFLVTWTDASGPVSVIKGQFYDASGTAIGAERTLSDPSAGAASDAHISALNNWGFAISYTSQAGSDPSAVVVSFYDKDGAQSGATTRLADSTGKTGYLASDIVTSAAGYVSVAFADTGAYDSAVGGVSNIHTAGFDPGDGRLATINLRASEPFSPSRNPSIAVTGALTPILGYEYTPLVYDPATFTFSLSGTPALVLLPITLTGAVGALEIQSFANESLAAAVVDPAAPGTLTLYMRLIGSAGDDVLGGGDAQYTLIQGNGGNDVITLSGGSTLISGGDGNDLISVGAASNMMGDAGNDTLRGSAQADTLSGGAGADEMAGGAGNDSYAVDDRLDRIIELAGDGVDTVTTVVDYVLAADVDVEVFSAGFQYDSSGRPSYPAVSLTGNLLAQALNGNLANNVLDGGGTLDTPGDTLSGGAGNDTLVVHNMRDRVIEAAGGGSDTVLATTSYSLAEPAGTAIASVEALVFANAASLEAIELTGNSVAQTIVGNFGDNRIDGGGGADTLIGLRGNDSYVVQSAAVRVVEAAGEGTDTVIVTAAGNNWVMTADSSIEILSAEAGAAAINLIGNTLSQVINGNDGANILSAGDGAPDTLNGGLGDDIYRVFKTGDVIDDTGGFDTVYVSGSSYFLYSGASIEYLSTSLQAGTETFYLVGNGASQVIVGNYGDNVLNGRGGDGNALPDTLIGLYGNDTYAVFRQEDVVREIAGGGNDVVYANADYQLRDGTEVEALAAADASSAIGGFVLRGNEFAQTVVGNQAGNVIDGRGGNDTLIGLGGSDTFAFTTALGTGNVDTLQDWAAGDRIGLASDIFAAVTDGGIVAGEFVIGTAAADADDRLVYDQATGKLWYDADGNGAATAVQFAQLAPGAAIAVGDFVTIAPVASLAGA